LPKAVEASARRRCQKPRRSRPCSGTRLVARAPSRFRGGLYTTKAATSAATPPKKQLRADYCRKNHEPGWYGHLLTLALGGWPLSDKARDGSPFISHNALAKITGRQRTASAWPALLVRRGNGLNGIDGPHSGTARPSAVAPLKRPASLSIDPIFGIFPTPSIAGATICLTRGSSDK
jgi:hypothetical protein